MTTSNTPAKIGRYPVLRVLGKGAMGCVYLARDTELDRDVAIKTVQFPEGLAEQTSFLVRFRNEARAVGRLRHRSIISVYDVGHDPESGPYLVFEYIEGANLKDILRSKGPLSPPELLLLAEQVGDALDAAHREGIIHRDIKPENLLVGRDQVMHLADFGVARLPDAALTGEGQFLGTPCYGAPETLQGGEAGPLSDQFSFAAVLYEAAAGVRAFPGTDALVVAHAVIHEEPKPPSRIAKAPARVPAEVDHVILRALSKQPNQRFRSLAELVQALSVAYAHAGYLAAPVAPDGTAPLLLPQPRGGARKRTLPSPRSLLFWPIGLFLLTGVAAAVYFAPRGGDTPGVLPDDTAVELERNPDPASTPPPPATIVRDAMPSAPDASFDVETEAGMVPLDAAALLSAFEREERAKDALERAEQALLRGDKAAAKAALDEAEAYDPEHPDIFALRRKL